MIDKIAEHVNQSKLVCTSIGVLHVRVLEHVFFLSVILMLVVQLKRHELFRKKLRTPFDHPLSRL